MSQGAKGGRVSCDAAKRCGFQTPIMRPNQRGWDNLMHLWHKIAAQFFALKGWSKFATHSGVPRPEANSNESAARFLKSSALTTSVAWRQASPQMRRRILEQPQLFFKAQREIEPPPPASLRQELLRDLEIVAAIVRRANRRLLRAHAEPGMMDGEQSEQVRQQLDHILAELRRLAARIPQAPEQAQPGKEDHVEPKSMNHDSGTLCLGHEQTRDRASRMLRAAGRVIWLFAVWHP
jgi:hypothetical protein